MSSLYTLKHRVWLSLTFASLAIEDEEIKAKLYDFSLIAFRHMKWIGESILEAGEDYNYDRDRMMLYRRECVFDILNELKKEIEELLPLYDMQTTLFQRIQTDEKYFVEYIDTLLQDENNNKLITAFNMQRKWEDRDLEQSQIDALTLFLFDESYKEYELILVYAYMQTRTSNALYYNVFQDLIDESHFHLKSFGNMMAKLGILALPRELHELTYIVDDLEKFIVDGIAEEEAAKIQCKELSDAIKDEELSKFFDFINYQENYHIELMQKLLKNLT
jgi:rubrerythrin